MKKLSVGFLLIIACHWGVIKATTNTDLLQCPSGKSALGMTLGVPSSRRWNAESSFFVCILCKGQHKEGADDDEDGEEDNNEERQHFKQEICSFYGEDTSRTLIQKFECVDGEYLQSFSKANNSLESTMTCRTMTSEEEDHSGQSVYESTLKRGSQTRVSSQNWEKWHLNRTNCSGSYGDRKFKNVFLCGLEIEAPSDEELPAVKSLCCSYEKNSGEFYLPLSSEHHHHRHRGHKGHYKAWIAVLSLLTIILTIALGVCTIHQCCCPILPDSCGQQQDRVSSYGSSTKSSGTASEFNTRPNTAAPKSARVKRPGTSTVRAAPAQISDVP